MLLSSLNTGSTDLRDTEVQQPNTTATLSWVISWRAFSANSGQLDAGSTTTGSSFLPSRPPLALISSIAISAVFFRAVSEIAMVPDSECRMPTLMVSAAIAVAVIAENAIPANDFSMCLRFIKRSPVMDVALMTARQCASAYCRDPVRIRQTGCECANQFRNNRADRLVRRRLSLPFMFL